MGGSLYLVIEYRDEDIVYVKRHVSGYIAGAFFLLDAADLCTTGARNIIAVASLTNELLGKGFRNYSISAHMRIIEAAEEEYPRFNVSIHYQKLQ